ncbi:MAG: acyl-CoA dehydrogenase family protein [Cytophagales bacterium]|nr:acyl-CoA dehydrogenase family protein [Cytophagales bacterium]
MPYFNEEHHLFRESLSRFVEKEVLPCGKAWEKAGKLPASIWKKMGDQGYLGLIHEEAYGGLNADLFYSVIFLEELAKSTFGGFAGAVAVQEYMATAHLAKTGSAFLKDKYLRPAIEGLQVAALAISEPGAGSNVAAMKTFARKKGSQYLLSGSKIFITNGFHADYITVAARTSEEKGTKGISLFVVEGNSAGLSRNKLEKMGWHSSDTAELFFDEVKIPQENLIGEAGQGFYYIMDSFQLERLAIGILASAASEKMLELSLDYMNERNVFGGPLHEIQVLRHQIARLSAEVSSLKQFIYHTAWLFGQKTNIVKECAMIKLKASELSKQVADFCLQSFGGYGYMRDYPIERMFRDARVNTIIGGTSEIMHEIIAKCVIDKKQYRSAYA